MQKKKVRRQSWGTYDYMIYTEDSKGNKIFVKIVDGGEKDKYYPTDEYAGTTEDFLADDWAIAKANTIQKFVVGFADSEIFVDSENQHTLDYVEKNLKSWYTGISYQTFVNACKSTFPDKNYHESENNDSSSSN